MQYENELGTDPRVYAFRQASQDGPPIHVVAYVADPAIRAQAMGRIGRALSTSYGPDLCRIMQILTRTEQKPTPFTFKMLLDPLLASTGPDGALDLPDLARRVYLPSLAYALTAMDPEDALRLFERSDIDLLARRDRLVRTLASGLAPLYRMHELETLTEWLIRYIEVHRDELISTGCCRTGYALSPWLSSIFSTLYFTKYPSEGRLLGDTTDGSSGPYAWRRYRRESGILVSANCSYDEADLVPGLDSRDAERLEGMRARLLDLRLRVLERILDGVRRRSSTGLWDDCAQMAANELTVDEMQFLASMDLFYAGFTGQTKELFRPLFLESGGLRSMFLTVIQYESELTTRAMDHTCGTLGHSALIALRSGIGYHDGYLELGGHVGRDTLDLAIDSALSLQESGRHFMQECYSRIDAAYRRQLHRTIEVSLRVPAEHANDVESYLRILADHGMRCIEQNGSLPDISYGPVRLGPPDGPVSEAGSTMAPMREASCDRNVFQKNGQKWTVAYASSHTILNDSDGATYIAYLLEHPHTSYHVRELYSTAHPPQGGASASPYCDMSIEQLKAEGLFLDGERSPTDTADCAQLRDACLAELRRIRGCLDRAESLGDSQEAGELRGELDRLTKTMAAEFGLGGNPRQPGDQNKKAYDRIHRAIGRTLKDIDEHLPQLATHLRTAVQYKAYAYTYRPDREISWDI